MSRVVTGLDRLAAGDVALEGKVALLAHPASIDARCSHVRHVLRERGADLVAIFGPVLRRASDTPGEEEPRVKIRHGKISIDPERHEVHWGTDPISLTPTEFGLLSALLERPGIVLSRGQLMQRAYSYDNLVTERTIDTHVRRIRAKFRSVGGDDPIATVHGVGYKASEAKASETKASETKASETKASETKTSETKASEA